MRFFVISVALMHAMAWAQASPVAEGSAPSAPAISPTRRPLPSHQGASPTPPIQTRADDLARHAAGALMGGSAALVISALPGLLCTPSTPACASLLSAGFVGGLVLTPALTWVGYNLAGGRAGPGALVAGYTFGLVALSLLTMQIEIVRSTETAAPSALAAGALGVGLMTAALLIREDQLSVHPSAEASVARFALESLVSIGVMALAGAGGLITLVALPTQTWLFLVWGGLGLAFAPAAATSIHWEHGGKGSRLSAYLGLGAGLGLTLASFLAFTTPRSVAFALGPGPTPFGPFDGLVPLIAVPLLGTLFGPSLGLEISNAIDLDVQLAAAPLPQGAMVLAGARF